MCYAAGLRLAARGTSPYKGQLGKLFSVVQLVHRYRNLVLGEELLESALHCEYPEYLNAEVVLRTIVNVASALAWLKSTYFYIRVRAPLISHRFSRHAISVTLYIVSM